MPKGGDPAKRMKKSATRPRSVVARAGRAPRPSIASEPHGDLNKLLAEPRRMKILAWLQEEGSARVRDLRVAFGVSEATIRQDLEKLESDGHVNRQHGGAFLRAMPKQVETLSLQHMENIEEKTKNRDLRPRASLATARQSSWTQVRRRLKSRITCSAAPLSPSSPTRSISRSCSACPRLVMPSTCPEGSSRPQRFHLAATELRATSRMFLRASFSLLPRASR